MTTNPAHDDASEAANQPAPAGQSSAITLRPSPRRRLRGREPTRPRRPVVRHHAAPQPSARRRIPRAQSCPRLSRRRTSRSLRAGPGSAQEARGGPPPKVAAAESREAQIAARHRSPDGTGNAAPTSRAQMRHLPSPGARNDRRVLRALAATAPHGPGIRFARSLALSPCSRNWPFRRSPPQSSQRARIHSRRRLGHAGYGRLHRPRRARLHLPHRRQQVGRACHSCYRLARVSRAAAAKCASS